VAQSSGGEIVQVRSKQGDLVIEYHAGIRQDAGECGGRATLSFVAKKGGIAFRSARDIRLEAPAGERIGAVWGRGWEWWGANGKVASQSDDQAPRA